MSQDCDMTPFGLAPIKQEGTTQDLETGETWMTTAEEQHLARLRDRAEQLTKWSLWLTGIAVTCTLINVAIIAWPYL